MQTGLAFSTETLQNISDLRVHVGINGGIKAGAIFFMVGSGLFAAEDYQQRIDELFNKISNYFLV